MRRSRDVHNIDVSSIKDFSKISVSFYKLSCFLKRTCQMIGIGITYGNQFRSLVIQMVLSHPSYTDNGLGELVAWRKEIYSSHYVSGNNCNAPSQKK